MIIEYSIKEEDYLTFQLFIVSQKGNLAKKRKRGQIILSAGSAIAALYCFYYLHYIMAGYFILCGVATLIFYPRYFNSKYKKHYEKHVRENYSKQSGEVQYLDIKEDAIYYKDKNGEGKYLLRGVEEIFETEKHFFLKLNTAQGLIIPKRDIAADELKTKLIELGKLVNEHKNWIWPNNL